ncbi:FRIGIDA-like protein 5 [Argentina anserina]|uniref:FRIGIDA-like protein 5 n=1 Tax=Argentina anserina TaxID=57926 RepID=UPI00217642E3|nr:FRIGIDA-like protein 5 [Potentilla anserina]
MEEPTAAELSELEAKQRRLGAAFESLSAHASSILQFTVEWKELEDYFESTRSALKARLQQLQDREKEAAEMQARLTAEVERRRKEAEEGEGYLESVKALIKENDEELRVREERYEGLVRLIREKEREVEEKSRKLNCVEKKIEVKVKEVEEVEVKKDEMVKVVKELEGKEDKVEKLIVERKKKLSGVRGVIEERRKELESMKEEVVKVERKLRGKEERLRLVEESMAEREKELSGVRREVEERRKEAELKEGEMVRVERRIEECERELKEKEERKKEVEDSIGECCRVLESKEEMVRVADEKGREFCLLKRSMEEWGCKVEVKERELEGLAAKLELKEREVGLKVEELGLIRNEVQLNEERLISLEKSLREWEKDLHSLQKSVEECSRGSVITRDGRGLQHFMDDHLKRIDSLGTDLSAILKESSDPGKLVLDAMQGFYPEKRESAFELRVRRRSCCLLLEELMRMSPQMNLQVKEEATKLAANWKAKMKVASDKDLEVLGFLWLVAAYGVTSYGTKEIKRLISNVSHGLQAAQIGRALGITELDDFIPRLVEEKQLFQALGFVFKFKLLDKFTPVRVLKDYLKDVSLSETLKRKKSVDEKVEFIDSQIADLKAVLQCIREYNLESEYPSKEIEVQIGELKKLKDICRGPENCLASVTRQQAQSRGKKRSSSTSPAVQPGQQKNKFHQTAEASPTSYKSPRFTPVHLHSTVSRLSPSLALAYGNNLQGGQVGDMASNSSEVVRSSSLGYRNHGQPGQVGNAAANSVEFDRSSSLVSGIHGQRGQLDHMAANLAEVNPHFGTIDEVDPHFRAPNLSNPYQLRDFTPFPARYGPY